MASDPVLLLQRLEELESRVGVLEAKERAAADKRSNDYKDLLDTKSLLQKSLDQCVAIKQECEEMLSIEEVDESDNPAEYVQEVVSVKQTLAVAFAPPKPQSAVPKPKAKAKKRGKGRVVKAKRNYYGIKDNEDDDAVEEIEMADMTPAIRRAEPASTSTFMTTEQAMELASDVNYTGCSIGNDMWEACILIGVEGVGREGSVLLALGLLTSAVARLSICAAIEIAMTDPMPGLQDAIDFREMWGHDPKYMSGKTLIARVCSGDASLPFATHWRDWRNDIEMYLNQHGPFRVGPMLAMSISIIWVSISFEEMQSCLILMAAMLQVPRKSSTDIEVIDGRSHFRSMPAKRFLFMILVTLLRLATSAWIMGLGLRWILKTKSITGILHSAIDFCFVLDVGKVIAPSFSSIMVNTIVSSMVPLGHIFNSNRPLGILLNIVTLATGAFLIILSWFVYLKNDMDHMNNLRNALCAGNQDFHTAWQSATGYVLSSTTNSTLTKKMDYDFLRNLQRRRDATHELIHKPTRYLEKSDPGKHIEKSRYYANYQVFSRALTRPANFVDDVLSCDDVCPRPASCDKKFLNMLKRDAGNFDKSLLSCADFKARCNEVNGDLVRRLCPTTCGCSNRTSGLFFTGDFNGCPKSLCESKLRHSLKHLDCEDTKTATLKASPAWQSIIKQILAFYADVLDQASGMSGKKFLEHGCEALDMMPGYKERFCNPNHQLLGSLHAWCPRRCGCTKRPYDSTWVISCPWSCKALRTDL